MSLDGAEDASATLEKEEDSTEDEERDGLLRTPVVVLAAAKVLAPRRLLVPLTK